MKKIKCKFCGETMEEFNLKEERKELFDIILKEKPTAGRIYRIIRKQDKEFIKRLKEGHNDELKKEIDGLAGEKLI